MLFKLSLTQLSVHELESLDPNRPIGSFLFMGPTGVGKTELTKALAGGCLMTKSIDPSRHV